MNNRVDVHAEKVQYAHIDPITKTCRYMKKSENKNPKGVMIAISVRSFFIPLSIYNNEERRTVR